MFGKLPKGILSTHGYLGCVANLELGHTSADPLLDAVVPSQEVVRGCQGKYHGQMHLSIQKKAEHSCYEGKTCHFEKSGLVLFWQTTYKSVINAKTYSMLFSVRKVFTSAKD